MEQLILFFCFLLCYDGRGVTGIGTLLDSETGDRGSLLISPTKDPDAERNVSELISSKGYPVEEHIVQTDDGYILTLIRIPRGKNTDSQDTEKAPVLLIHGDVSNAVQWVLDFPNQSLGFILADNGYDTWLLNNRGCRYSKKHIQYTTKDARFWNFSLDELAEFDLPATIDYILKSTDEDDLYVIGHSRGGGETFAMLSEKPDYNKKVRLFIAMAPATFISHMTSPVRGLVPIAEELASGINLLTSGEFSPDNSVTRKIKEEFCAAPSPELCEFFIFAIGGADKAQLNQTRIDVYASHFPSSTSTRSLLHFAQNIRAEKFRKYDFGPKDNLKYYHQEAPPDYNLSSIATPVALFWSRNDKLVDPRDVAILRNHLNSVVYNHRVRHPYNHFDFAVSKNAPEKLYKPVLNWLSKY